MYTSFSLSITGLLRSYGKDVYCEKPPTLSIDEGKLLSKVVQQTGRVFQVGSRQRSDRRFRLACEMVHAARIGKLQRVTVKASSIRSSIMQATSSTACATAALPSRTW